MVSCGKERLVCVGAESVAATRPGSGQSCTRAAARPCAARSRLHMWPQFVLTPDPDTILSHALAKKKGKIIKMWRKIYAWLRCCADILSVLASLVQNLQQRGQEEQNPYVEI